MQKNEAGVRDEEVSLADPYSVHQCQKTRYHPQYVLDSCATHSASCKALKLYSGSNHTGMVGEKCPCNSELEGATDRLTTSNTRSFQKRQCLRSVGHIRHSMQHGAIFPYMPKTSHLCPNANCSPHIFAHIQACQAQPIALMGTHRAIGFSNA